MNDETFDKKKLLKGLTDEEVKKQREKYGSNKLPEKEQETFWDKFKSNLDDPMLKLLIIILILTRRGTLKRMRKN